MNKLGLDGDKNVTLTVGVKVRDQCISRDLGIRDTGQ